MPEITGLYSFPTGSPVDPAQLNGNFGIVEDAFNDSAVRSDDPAVQALAGPLEGILRDTEFARSVKLSTIGAKGDTVSVTASISSGSTTLVSAASAFAAGDVGKAVSVPGAGTTGGALVTTITGYTDPTHVTLAAAATATVTGAAATYGTNDAPEFGALTPGTYLVPPGLYLFSTGATVADEVVLVFARGARLTRFGFTVLAFKGEIVAGRYTIFEAEHGFLAGSRPKNRVVLPEWWGVKADAATAAGGAVASGSAVLTTTSSSFAASDVGKQVEVPGAGASGATLATTIAGYTSATQVTLAANAATTVTGKTVTFGTDDTATLSRAIGAAGIFAATAEAAGAAGGAVVSLRAGTYLVNGTGYVRPVSNVTLSGTGRGATVFKHAAAGGYGAMLLVESVHNVTVEEIGFDFAEGPALGSIIGLRGTDTADVTVRGCRFFDSNAPTDTSTSVPDRFAIAFSSDNPLLRIRIIDNECRDRLQLTAGGGVGVKYLWIERNYVEHAEQNAIAVSSLNNDAVFEYVYIRGNYIKDTHAIGIYVGEDSVGNTNQTFRFIYIVDNVVDGFGYDSVGNNAGIFCTAVDAECADYEIRGNDLRGAPATQHAGIVMLNRLGGSRTFRRVNITGNRVEGFEKSLRIGTLHDASISGNLLRRGPVGGGTALHFEGTDFEGVSVVGNQVSNFISGCSIRAGKFDLAGNSLGNCINYFGSAALVVKPLTGETAVVNAEGNFLGDNQATHTQQYGIYHNTTGGGSFDCRYVDNDLRGVVQTGGQLFNVDESQRVLDNHSSASTGLIGPRWERVATASLTFTAPSAVPGESPASATVTVTGARAGDSVQVTAPGAVPAGFVAPYGWVSANDTVTLLWMQVAGTAAAAPSGTYRVRVSKF